MGTPSTASSSVFAGDVRLDVSPRTVRRWLRRGLFGSVVDLGGGDYRITAVVS